MVVELLEARRDQQPVQLLQIVAPQIRDRAGRLQIPKEYLEALGIRGGDKVRVELEDGKISVYNSDYNMHG